MRSIKRELTLKEVFDLRDQIVLNSLFASDYRNALGVDPIEACDFFDGFVDFLQELAEEDGFEIDGSNYNEFFEKYDTKDNLEEWWGCFEECPLHAEEEEE